MNPNANRRHARGAVLWRWLPWLMLVAVLAAGGLRWRSSVAQSVAAEPPSAEAIVGDIEDTVTALGSLQPREFVDVGTQVSGQLKRLRVGIGDTVRKDQLLAEIDTAVFQARVEAAQAAMLNLDAQIREKLAQHSLAVKQHERNVALHAEDAVSREVLDNSLAATQITAAQVASLRAQRQQTAAAIRVDEANLGFARIHTPIAGTVVSLSAREGQTLNANQQAPVILRIANLGTMTVVAQVSEADVSRIRPGTPAWFSTLGRSDRRWEGRVRQIQPTPEMVNNVVLYNVLFDVDNPDGELRSQMSAQVSFVLARASQAVLVPLSALADRGGARKPRRRDGAATAANVSGTGTDAANLGRERLVRVWHEGKIQERTVRVGIGNRLSVQVLSGLQAGERVLLPGAGSGEGKRAQGGAKEPRS